MQILLYTKNKYFNKYFFEYRINNEISAHTKLDQNGCISNELLLEEKRNLEKENRQLNMQITQLQAENIKLKKDRQKEVEELTTNILRSVFTPGQIKLLMLPEKKRIKWTFEDMVSAISLRSYSPRTYKYLRNIKQIPLPCLTSIHNWIAKFDVSPGILKHVIQIMASKGYDLPITDKLTILTFDEMYISNKIDLDKKEQKIYGPHKACQFIMARGLFKKWKQPIYYNFDVPMSRNILFNVIQHLYEADYIVVAVTCDMGPSNMKLWKELEIGTNDYCNTKNTAIVTDKQCFIVHPFNNSLKIFFYADVPHLLKCARNNFFDSGFIINGVPIGKNSLVELLTLNKTELKIAHKLSSAHLDVKGTKRQNVKMAAQVFSNTNALALQWCGENNNLLVSLQWKQTSEILKLFNDWFDVFNSNLKYQHNSASHAYGINLEKQDKIINDMNIFIKEMRVGRRKDLLQFQKGILLCNKSLQEMFTYLQHMYSSEAFDVKYLLTRRLNQDILENFFSYLRSMGKRCDHPTPVQLKHHLKWYILGKDSGHMLSAGENTEGDNNCATFINMEAINSPDFINLDISDFPSENENITEEEAMFMSIQQSEEDIMNLRTEEIENYGIEGETVQGSKN